MGIVFPGLRAGRHRDRHQAPAPARLRLRIDAGVVTKAKRPLADAKVEVREVPNRPLIAGETMLEVIAMAGRRDQAIWTVLACVPPERWEITTDTSNGMAHIIYTIVSTEDGCRFHGTLEFRSKRWPWRHLDVTLTRWILKRQSSRALQNLKAVLEQRRSPD